MFAQTAAWIAVILLFAASAGLLINRDWRWNLGLMAAIYFASFWLIARHWPFGMAAVKLVTGWMCVTILGMTLNTLPAREPLYESAKPRGSAFYIFAAGIVAAVVVASAPRMEIMISGIGLQTITGSLLLIGMGLLHLSATSEIMRSTLALLTVLAGFETIYAALEGSVLLTGLLTVANLGLAAIGSFLLYRSFPVDEETE